MAPPAGVLCAGCGLEFKYLEPPRENCFKCEKLDKCGGNATEMAAVEKLKQCLDCGLVYKYLPDGRTQCVRCEQRDTKSHKSSKDKENIGKKEQKATSTSSSAVVEVIDDSDDLNNGSDSDIQEVQQQQMDILKSKLAQNKKTSSSIRLTRKVKDESDEVPSATLNFLKLRETARKRTNMSKSTQLLFKVTVNLQKPAGQKVGTCVPAQSRGFEFEDKMECVFRTMVDMVQERGGRWEQIYPGKTFRREDVHFTFSGGMDIPPKYRSEDSTVAKFWSAFTRQENQFFKKSAIANCIAEITMLVPIELTIDPVDDSDSDGDLIDEILGTKKHRKSAKKSRGAKKLKVKEEEADFPMSVKSEPIETGLCSTRSITQRQKVPAKPTPSLCFTSPVTFTKEFLSTSLDHPTNTEQFQGLRDLVPKSTPSLGTHFRLSCGDDHYLARRLESSQFRFSPELELEAARGELNRGHQLKTLLAMLIDKYGTNVLGLSEYSTPDLFIATVREQNTVLGHLVCQPKPDIPFNKVVEPELDILNAISHYSLVQNNNALLFTKFKVASVNGSLSIFAPITHSRSSSSGLYDEGPEAIDQFMDEHVCNDICDGFGLAPF